MRLDGGLVAESRICQENQVDERSPREKDCSESHMWPEIASLRLLEQTTPMSEGVESMDLSTPFREVTSTRPGTATPHHFSSFFRQDDLFAGKRPEIIWAAAICMKLICNSLRLATRTPRLGRSVTLKRATSGWTARDSAISNTAENAYSPLVSPYRPCRHSMSRFQDRT